MAAEIFRIGTVDVEVAVGDITRQPDLDAVVNAANAELMPGGGVAGAIHRAAGPQLAEACRPLAPIAPGQAVLTPGFELPNPWVIHCLGPVYGLDEPADGLLASCYREAIRLAEEQGLGSIGFPAISTGAFGYPLESAAAVTVTAVSETLQRGSSLRLARFLLFDEGALSVYRRELERQAGQI